MLIVNPPPFKLSEYTDQDSEGNALLTSHAYLAQSAGGVSAFTLGLDSGEEILLYVGPTDNPAGAGDLIEGQESSSTDEYQSVSARVAKDEYFEIICPKATTIRWKSVGSLRKPVDFN